MAAARIRAVASVSEPSKAGSLNSTPSQDTSVACAQVIASRTASAAPGGPRHTMVTVPSPTAAASSHACATARRQNGFNVSARDGTGPPPSSSGDAASRGATGFTTAAIRIAVSAYAVSTPRG